MERGKSYKTRKSLTKRVILINTKGQNKKQKRNKIVKVAGGWEF